MKVAGVITEYNPFHNGHAFQLKKIKEATNCDYIIVAMSGNFVQRGEPAIIDKYTRARCALLNGADLVLEIPALWASASAEYFANAGVNLLSNTGVLDYLCFGAETEDLNSFCHYARLLNNENNCISEKISNFQKSGLPYPLARAKAFQTIFGADFNKDFWDNISLPNNALSIEYLRVLERLPKDITPVLIKRIGAGYHDTSVNDCFSSASAIRKLLNTKNDNLCKYMPISCANILTDFDREYGFVFAEDISPLLAYRLLCEKGNGLEQYADVSQSLSGSIRKNIYKFESFHQFCQLLKTKNYTYTRISRSLLHILLQIKATDYQIGKACNFSPYMRVLGFNKNATQLMHTIKKEACCPLITKLADASSLLDENAYKLLQHDIFATDIYNQLLVSHKKSLPSNEFSHGVVIV